MSEEGHAILPLPSSIHEVVVLKPLTHCQWVQRVAEGVMFMVLLGAVTFLGLQIQLRTDELSEQLEFNPMCTTVHTMEFIDAFLNYIKIVVKSFHWLLVGDVAKDIRDAACRSPGKLAWRVLKVAKYEKTNK